MELGEKLRQARQQAGLSQRQLCGSVITRNMLSQIENGSAHPSMATLRYFAQQLGLPISYFLEEETVSGNRACMENAWAALEGDRPEEGLELLADYRPEDPIYDREYRLVRHLLLLKQAEESGDRQVYARQLLSQAQELEEAHPWLPELKMRRICLLARMGERLAEKALPSADDLLYLHASAALGEGRPARAAAVLEAVAERTPEWFFLRGRAALAQEEYGTAARCLQEAEAAYPAQTVPLLERCFRELGDYKMAYTYACKGRSKD